MSKKSFSIVKPSASDMRELWKATFGDSDRYLDIVFSTYYDSGIPLGIYEGDRLVSMLLGIPYNFGPSDHSVRGLYLCGLCTDPEFKNRGMVTALINRAAERGAADDCAFAFLIPANDGLRKFYYDRGFVNAFYNYHLAFPASHNFELEYAAFLKKHDGSETMFRKLRYYDVLKSSKVGHIDESLEKELLDFLIKNNNEINENCICYTAEDWKVIIEENILSHNSIFYTYYPGKSITGICFCDTSNIPEKITVKYLLAIDRCSAVKLLTKVSENYSKSSIELVTSEYPEDAEAIWYPFHEKMNVSQADTGPMAEVEESPEVTDHRQLSVARGMLRILDESEILKFLDKDADDSEFSNLAKEPIGTRDLARLVCRRYSSPDYVMEAYGLPPLELSCPLLLD